MKKVGSLVQPSLKFPFQVNSPIAFQKWHWAPVCPFQLHWCEDHRHFKTTRGAPTTPLACCVQPAHPPISWILARKQSCFCNHSECWTPVATWVCWRLAALGSMMLVVWLMLAVWLRLPLPCCMFVLVCSDRECSRPRQEPQGTLQRKSR